VDSGVFVSLWGYSVLVLIVALMFIFLDVVSMDRGSEHYITAICQI
jgi:hypothetical protein